MTSYSNKYGLENFQGNLERLNSFLRKLNGREIACVFDIGTKAARLLIGYKNVPHDSKTWNPGSFFNDGQVFNLGDDFNIHDRMLDADRSLALEGVIYFMNTYIEILKKYVNIDNSDITAIGTAVFRWLKNKNEIINKIEEETGIKVSILEENDEAFLSAISVYHTTTWEKKYRDDEAILLVDQGGGSTEISYFFPNKLTVYKHDSINDLGTVVLQKLFFGLNNDEMIDPQSNRRRISTQFQRINDYIDSKIDEWNGFPEIQNGEIKLTAFGMGTAIQKCFPAGSNYSLHNRLLTLEDMQNILTNYTKNLEESNQQVRTLYNLINTNDKGNRKNISKRLVLLYGLPVYQKMLKKFKVDKIRYASYGLRYGAYIAKYKYGLDLHNLNKRLSADVSENSDNRVNENVIRRRSSEEKVNTVKKYKIALSFAGEYRNYVGSVADLLASRLGKNKVFYDKYHEQDLARPNLDLYLQDIYHNQAEKIAIFIADKYEEKEWCGIEWRSIRDIIKKRRNDDILFIKVGEGDVSGVLSIDGCWDGIKYGPNKIAELILKRLE